MDPIPDITHDGERGKTFQEKAELFRAALFPSPPIADKPMENEEPTRRLPWLRVTHKEMYNAITSSSSSKAPGPDGLGFE